MNCPICGKPTRHNVRPFCSKRCSDIDLALWFNESYAVPSDDPEDLEALEEAMDQAVKTPDTIKH